MVGLGPRQFRWLHPRDESLEIMTHDANPRDLGSLAAARTGRAPSETCCALGTVDGSVNSPRARPLNLIWSSYFNCYCTTRCLYMCG